MAEEAEAFRKAHGLDGKFVVMRSGNLSHIHPLDTVLDAVVRLKDNPSIAFVFVGQGRRGTDIDRRIRDHGLTNIVRLPHQPREAQVEHNDVDELIVAIRWAREMSAPEREAVRETNRALVADRFGRQGSLDLFAEVVAGET